jgi:hypothetical protein
MAGSNNFTIHNPTNANQEPDSTFASDSLTTGGIGTDAILPSLWLNARWYEDSVGFFCLAQAMANKGYAVNKDNPTALEAVLANLVTNADLRQPLVAVSYSPTPVFPASTANGFELILSGNVSSSTFDVTPAIGQILTFVIVQGATPFTFVPPSVINGWVPISVVANSVNVQQFIVLEDGSIWPLNTTGGQKTTNTVTGSRAFGTTYTAGANIFVGVTGELNLGVGHTATIQAVVGGVIGATSSITNSSGMTYIGFFVAAGQTYQVNTGGIGPGDSGNVATVYNWQETFGV